MQKEYYSNWLSGLNVFLIKVLRCQWFYLLSLSLISFASFSTTMIPQGPLKAGFYLCSVDMGYQWDMKSMEEREDFLISLSFSACHRFSGSGSIPSWTRLWLHSHPRSTWWSQEWWLRSHFPMIPGQHCSPYSTGPPLSRVIRHQSQGFSFKIQAWLHLNHIPQLASDVSALGPGIWQHHLLHVVTFAFRHLLLLISYLSYLPPQPFQHTVSNASYVFWAKTEEYTWQYSKKQRIMRLDLESYCLERESMNFMFVSLCHSNIFTLLSVRLWIGKTHDQERGTKSSIYIGMAWRLFLSSSNLVMSLSSLLIFSWLSCFMLY